MKSKPALHQDGSREALLPRRQTGKLSRRRPRMTAICNSDLHEQNHLWLKRTRDLWRWKLWAGQWRQALTLKHHNSDDDDDCDCDLRGAVAWSTPPLSILKMQSTTKDGHISVICKMFVRSSRKFVNWRRQRRPPPRDPSPKANYEEEHTQMNY